MKANIEFLYIPLVLVIALSSCNKNDDDDTSNQESNNPIVFDSILYGGQYYKTVEIGDQTWMAENLNIGTQVKGVQGQSNNDTIEKFCFDDSTHNCDKYGGLYQWDELMSYSEQEGTQGICPDGWHIPSDDEWKVLEGYVDSKYSAIHPEWDNSGPRGLDAGSLLKSTTGWKEDGNGADSFGFNILASGRWDMIDDNFQDDGGTAYFWTSSQSEINIRPIIRFFMKTSDQSWRTQYLPHWGKSVRCIKDE